MNHTEIVTITSNQFYGYDNLYLTIDYSPTFPTSYAEAETYVKGLKYKGRAVIKIVSLSLTEDTITAKVELETHPSEQWVLKAQSYLSQMDAGRVVGGSLENSARFREFIETGIDLVKQRPMR